MVKAGFARVFWADVLVDDDFDRNNIELFRGFTIYFNELAAATGTSLLCRFDVVNDLFARNAIRKWLASADFTLMCFDFPEFIRWLFFFLQQSLRFVEQALLLRR
jgi:hypothetical protein